MSVVKFVKGGTAGIAATAIVEGQILYDVESKMYYIDHKVNNVLTRILMGVKEPFVGTQAEWDALTPTEKAYYADTTIMITDDYIERSDEMEGPTPTAPGKAGLVPVPQIGDDTKFLKGDGTWATITSASAYWEYDSSTENVTYVSV